VRRTRCEPCKEPWSFRSPSSIDASPNLSKGAIEHFNGMVLRDLPLDEKTRPGRIRNHSVGVARYRGAPHQDCAYLLDRLCGWLNESDLNTSEPSKRVPYAILKAVIAQTEADRRRLRLVLDLTKHYGETLEPVAKRDLRHLSPTLSEAYAGKTVKTLTRDLNAVLATGLLEAEDHGYVPRDWIILTFRPQRRDVSSR
jgi:hypothetical protein